jgi:DNA-binding GntR family transcriptional regulator
VNPLVRPTVHEQVRETLRQAILTGQLAGGTRLVQADIAKDLDVSITPVREALRDLANEQMIHLDPRRGGIVHTLTGSELQEILDLRMVLEALAIQRAAEQITPGQLERAQSLHDRMLSATASYSWVMLNRSFHLTIYEAAGLPRLLAILRNLLDASVMYVNAADEYMPEHRERAGDDHAAILKLLADHDAEGAVEAIKTHINIPREILRLRS